MQDLYLEVTFRHGQPLAGYLYLLRSEDAKSSRVKKCGPREPDMTDFCLGSNRIAKHRAASNCVRIFGDRL